MLIKFNKPNAGVFNVVIPALVDPKEKNLPAERRVHKSPKFVSLVPGVNEIPDKTWNRIKDTERIQSYLKSGYIVLVNAEKVESKKAGEPAKDLTVKEYKALSSDEQIALINDCELLKLLEKWRASTKEAAKTVLNDKIDKLKNPEKYQEED